MRKLKAWSAALFLAGMLPAGLHAFGAGDKGTSGASFLKVAPGARPTAMGEAFAGVADDVHAVYYNPAGLGFLKKVEITGMHESRFQGVNYDFAALSVPLLSWVETPRERNTYGVMAVAVYSLTVGGIERRGTTETDTASETFGASDAAYAFSYAYALPDTGLSLGLTAKFIDSKIDSANAGSFAADGGLLYKKGPASLGGGVRNMGTAQKFRSAADPLPLTIFTGAGYKIKERFLVSVEGDFPRDNKVSIGVGGEYRQPFAGKLIGAARLGFNSKNTDPGGLSGVAWGFGLGYSNFDFDFAWVPFGDLGNAFKYSLVVKF